RQIRRPGTTDREPKGREPGTPRGATLVAGGRAVVQLRAVDGTAVQVEAIEARVPALTCRWAAGPGDRATVRISLDRSKWDGRPFASDVRVRLTAPAGETVVIPLSVRAEE